MYKDEKLPPDIHVSPDVTLTGQLSTSQWSCLTLDALFELLPALGPKTRAYFYRMALEQEALSTMFEGEGEALARRIFRQYYTEISGQMLEEWKPSLRAYCVATRQDVPPIVERQVPRLTREEAKRKYAEWQWRKNHQAQIRWMKKMERQLALPECPGAELFWRFRRVRVYSLAKKLCKAGKPKDVAQEACRLLEERPGLCDWTMGQLAQLRDRFKDALGIRAREPTEQEILA